VSNYTTLPARMPCGPDPLPMPAFCWHDSASFSARGRIPAPITSRQIRPPARRLAWRAAWAWRTSILPVIPFLFSACVALDPFLALALGGAAARPATVVRRPPASAGPCGAAAVSCPGDARRDDYGARAGKGRVA